MTRSLWLSILFIVTTLATQLAAQTVSITAPISIAAESGAAGSFAVHRTGSTAAPLTVTYSVDGTATAGVDYVALSGSVEIPAGAMSALIPVTPIDDALAEGDEYVVVTLTEGGPYDYAVVTIVDDEAGAESARVSVVALSHATEKSGGAPAVFEVRRSGGDTTGSLLLEYGLTGTATSGADYATLSGFVSIAAGAANAQVMITPVDDALLEGQETVTLTLKPAAGVDLETPLAILFIADDEAPDISVAVHAPSIVGRRSTLVSEVVATNAGPLAASGVTLNIEIPAAAQFVSAVPAGGSCATASRPIACTLGTIEPAASVAVRITLIAPQAETTLTFGAIATMIGSEGSTINNSAIALTEVVAAEKRRSVRH